MFVQSREITISRPLADREMAVELLTQALRPTPIDDWLGPKDSARRRVGKEMLSLGFARRVKAPRTQRHLCQKFVVATGVGRLFRDRLARSAGASVTAAEALVYAG